MGGFIGRILSFLTWPFRLCLRLLTGRSAQTLRKSGAGFVGGQAEEAIQSSAPVDEPAGKNLFFHRLARPKLSERTASDLTLEEARDYVAQAEMFYTYRFPLFTRSDFFYEEVEQDYIDTILGKATHGIDSNFLTVMREFRKVINANTGRLFLLYTPILLMVTLAAVLLVAYGLNVPVPVLLVDGVMMLGVEADTAPRIAVEVIALSLALALLTLLYQWPYKVTQQHNLLGLDNYITSKFSRINQNFQVAKRRSMNVERNMRMHQADQLKDEAGVWTLAYQWFAMRLLFCEMTVRNVLYQIRRNTTLYSIGGFVVSAVLTAAVLAAAIWVHLGERIGVPGAQMCWEIAILATIFVTIANFIVTRNATRDTLSVLQANEWNRFHLVNLHETVRDHVGEDKLQIVTFRDRNRIE